MLEILLIIGVGKWMQTLATKYNKPYKWLYPLIGTLTYVIFGIGGAAIIIISNNLVETDGYSTSYGLLSIPFGGAAILILYLILSRTWKAEKESQMNKDQLLDETE